MSTPAERSARQHLRQLIKAVKQHTRRIEAAGLFIQTQLPAATFPCEAIQAACAGLRSATVIAQRYGVTSRKKPRLKANAGQGSAPRAATGGRG